MKEFTALAAGHLASSVGANLWIIGAGKHQTDESPMIVMFQINADMDVVDHKIHLMLTAYSSVEFKKIHTGTQDAALFICFTANTHDGRGVTVVAYSPWNSFGYWDSNASWIFNSADTADINTLFNDACFGQNNFWVAWDTNQWNTYDSGTWNTQYTV